MGKKTFRGVVEKIARWLVLGFFIILTAYPLFLPYVPIIRDSQTTALESIFTYGAVITGLLGVVWIARRMSWRVRHATDQAAETAGVAGRYVFAVLGGLTCLGLGAFYAFDLSNQLTSEWW